MVAGSWGGPLMLFLVNSNRMQPPIAPVGLEYVAAAALDAGIPVEVVDLGLADNPDALLADRLDGVDPHLVGVSFRNADDSYWPSARWFVDDLGQLVRKIRSLTDAPIVLGGVGFSIFAERIINFVGADFGIRGDGETALAVLAAEVGGGRRYERVPGLLWRDDSGAVRANPPAWPAKPAALTRRDVLDNPSYFRLGGQVGLETKRGCPRRCIYCADPLAKGPRTRLRAPADVATEAEGLVRQGVDVLHLCDGEFNIPLDHAKEVCRAFIAAGLGGRMRWYVYMAVSPFDDELAALMRRAGCAGVDFTGDAGTDAMLLRLNAAHRSADLAEAVSLCRRHGITCMVDLLIGGPGETPETVASSIGFLKRIGPDCVGAGVGMRLYPGTLAAEAAVGERTLDDHPAIRRRYGGSVDLFRPTYYIAEALGERPAALVRDAIGGDERFFPPVDNLGQDIEQNYDGNLALTRAIAAGARGAYWDILRHRVDDPPRSMPEPAQNRD